MTARRSDTIGRLNYVEFCVPATEKAKAFYQKAFGWALVDFGPTYAATVSGDTDIGLQANNPGGHKPPLPVRRWKQAIGNAGIPNHRQVEKREYGHRLAGRHVNEVCAIEDEQLGALIGHQR